MPSLGANLRALDLRALRVMRTRRHSPAAEAAVVALARAGENGLFWYAVAAGGMALDRGRRQVYARSIGVVLTTLVANTAVKQLVRRAQPALEDLPALTPVISGRSYPSAHASTSFAARGRSRQRCRRGPSTVSRWRWPCPAPTSACTTRPTS